VNFQRQVLIGNLHVFPVTLIYEITLLLEVNLEKQLSLPIDKMACSVSAKFSVAYSFTES
jgi:hypothetical protein